MTIAVNPDVNAKDFNPQQTYNVTAVIDEIVDLIMVIKRLHQAGFTENNVGVFVGQEGLSRLAASGEENGSTAGMFHTIESLSAENRAKEDSESALREGHSFITVTTDGTEEQKQAVEALLKRSNARNLRFFGRWTIEHL